MVSIAKIESLEELLNTLQVYNPRLLEELLTAMPDRLRVNGRFVRNPFDVAKKEVETENQGWDVLSGKYGNDDDEKNPVRNQIEYWVPLKGEPDETTNT